VDQVPFMENVVKIMGPHPSFKDFEVPFRMVVTSLDFPFTYQDG